MNLSEVLSRDAVLPDLTSKTKMDVLAELTAPLLAFHPELQSCDIVSILRQREAMGTTAIGEGVAIPHGKVAGLTRLALSVGRSRKGIDFAATDGQVCHIFFLILAPVQGADQHLRLLAQIARRAKDPVFRYDMMMAETQEHLWQTLVAP